MSAFEHEAVGGSGVEDPKRAIQPGVARINNWLFANPEPVVERCPARATSLDINRSAWLQRGSAFQLDAELAAVLRARHRGQIETLIRQVRVHSNAIEIDCCATAVRQALGIEAAPEASELLTLTAGVTLTRTGRALRLVQGGRAITVDRANPSLTQLLVKARRWWTTLREGELDIKRLAATEGVQASYITRVLRLAFLSPSVVDGILGGSIEAGVDAAALTATDAVHACWRAQATTMLPA